MAVPSQETSCNAARTAAVSPTNQPGHPSKMGCEERWISSLFMPTWPADASPVVGRHPTLVHVPSGRCPTRQGAVVRAALPERAQQGSGIGGTEHAGAFVSLPRLSGVGHIGAGAEKPQDVRVIYSDSLKIRASPCQTARAGFYRSDDTARLPG